MCPRPQLRLERPDFKIQTSRKGGKQSFPKLKPLSTEGGGPGVGLKGSQSPPRLGGGGDQEKAGGLSECAKLEDKRKGSRIEGQPRNPQTMDNAGYEVND